MFFTGKPSGAEMNRIAVAILGAGASVRTTKDWPSRSWEIEVSKSDGSALTHIATVTLSEREELRRVAQTGRSRLWRLAIERASRSLRARMTIAEHDSAQAHLGPIQRIGTFEPRTSLPQPMYQ